ncbi:MAG: hypothetical protein DRQ60_01405 [Gammaproteobacteria bacterium]|nr:MAG: hypothetical protein DRQ60_01405 [Gammaproteobacteria bacterium]
MRDYKKKSSKPTRRKQPQQTGIKPGRAFIAGLIMGVALTLTVQNWSQVRHFLLGPATEEPVKKQATTPKTDDEIEFEFYTRLPKMEVPIDTTVEEARDKKEREKYYYMLQVGSFDRRADAERLKAQLALLGEVATIQDVSVNGSTMHRVRLGSFNSSRKLNSIEARLTRENIPTMALKIRKPD